MSNQSKKLILNAINALNKALVQMESEVDAPSAAAIKADPGASPKEDSNGIDPTKRPPLKNHIFANSLPENDLVPIVFGVVVDGDSDDPTTRPYNQNNFDELLKEWPPAAAAGLIIGSHDEEAQQYRALQVVSILSNSEGLPTIKGKNVLDIGCGAGYITNEMSFLANKTVGYELTDNSPIDQAARLSTDHRRGGPLFTSDKDEVIKNGPYDFILLHDVLDHASAPIKLLELAKEVLSDDGVIFIRNHPWVSRTGGHLYETVNKGFLHLFLTPNEMSKLGYKMPFNLKVTRPMASYEGWFEKVGLKVSNRKIKTSPIEPYFTDKTLKLGGRSILDRIIQVTWAGKIKEEQAILILKNDTVDYQIKKIDIN
tara:strand:- start:123 stop:1232 length:1110 start_codon:yes stop_codon:yes gene_type:complete